MLDYINNFISNTFSYATIPNFQWSDIIELIILTLIVYNVKKRIVNTRILIISKGILIMLGVYGLMYILNFAVLASIFKWFIIICLVGIIIACQPELKKIMESAGNHNYIRDLIEIIKKDKETPLEFSEETFNSVVDACEKMSKTNTGALIVFELDTPLQDIVATGIKLDAVVTKQMLIQIFEKNTPLHDGAIVIKHNRISSATCYLPLSNNLKINKDLGTRHRAGIGVTEQVDCFVIIVSEENGAISWVKDGIIRHKVTLKELKSQLYKIQHRKDIVKVKRKKVESIRDLKVKNIKEKILAFAYALLIWVAMLSIVDPVTTKRVTDVEVSVTNDDIIEDAEQTYSITNGNTLSVIIKGRRSELDNISKSDIKATADIRDMSKVNSIPIEINIKNSNILVTYQSKNSLYIELDSISEKVVEVECEITGKLKDDTYVNNMITQDKEVIVKGANSVISIIDRVVLPVDVTNQTNNFNTKCKPIIYDRNGDKISSNNLVLSKDNFEVTVEMLNTKTVNLDVNLINNNQDEFRVLEYSLEKNNITLCELNNNIDRIRDLNIEVDISEDISNITSNKLVKTINIDDYIDNDIKVAGTNSKINITVSVETSESKELKIDINKIRIDNVKSGYKCIFTDTGEYTLKIISYDNNISDITIDDLELYVDMTGSNDNGHIELKASIINEKYKDTCKIKSLPLISFTLSK